MPISFPKPVQTRSPSEAWKAPVGTPTRAENRLWTGMTNPPSSFRKIGDALKPLAILLGFLSLCPSPAGGVPPPADPPEEVLVIDWELPPVGVAGIPMAISLTPGKTFSETAIPAELTAVGPGGTPLAVRKVLLEAGRTTFLEPFPVDRTGILSLRLVTADGSEFSRTLRVLPGVVTLLPPLFAIFMALAFRQVVIALSAGVWLGALFLYDFRPLAAILRTVDHFALESLTDSDHISILMFTLLLGGMIGVISRSGGVQGIVNQIARFATNRRRGQLATWALGILVFFDDYSNTLIVGPTMRPVTDRLRISREKLAYIVDTTAATIASIALVSSWIGMEVSLIGDGFRSAGIARQPYSTFLATIPYCFYPWMALILCFIIGYTGRDFGTMWRAETRARGGQVLADSAAPLSDFDASSFAPLPGRPQRWWNALLPVFALTVFIFAGLWWDGRAALAAQGVPAGIDSPLALLLSPLAIQNLGQIFGEADSFRILLGASLVGCLVALALAFSQRLLTLTEGLQAWLEGIKAMLPAFVVLTLAWSIGLVCSELQTADYLVSLLSGALTPLWLPTLIFLSASVISFATGTSWGTMAILLPIVIPLAHKVCQTAPLEVGQAEGVLLGSIASVLAGAVFGDHCSPISDTTILSSMATSSDHIDHVRTQLPYALVGAGTAILFGTLPAGLGFSPWLGILAGTVFLALLVRFLGRPAPG